jgi:hypothetical protein
MELPPKNRDVDHLILAADSPKRVISLLKPPYQGTDLESYDFAIQMI